MALAELTIFSGALGMQTNVNVVIPTREFCDWQGMKEAEPKKPFKCLYLLHGLSDCFSTWLRRSSIERYADRYGVCIVMPDGDKSFYTDMKYGLRYYTYIAKELPLLMNDMFNVSEKREDNFIAGLSMGGYGALKIGMRECDSFCAAAAFSAVADINSRKDSFRKELICAFGDEINIPETDDLFALSEKCDKNPNKPRIFMSVGYDDYMYEDNVRLKEHFEKLSFDYTYCESDGAHTWEFWDEYIQRALEWMLDNE